jgi:hypothetical protein
MKYLVVTGGVVSGLGKGISISSMGVMLKACGLRVTAIKIDPYLNSDAGTMSPFEHGEVFVLNDGGEADLDLGNYEREPPSRARRRGRRAALARLGAAAPLPQPWRACAPSAIAPLTRAAPFSFIPVRRLP